MTARPFAQVDVFTAVPYRGNPVAVVLDGTGLADDDLQRFAAWTNLSETTFVLPPTTAEADYRVRIFTPSAELPFAGHPTLGTCHAWLGGGGRPRQEGVVVQECGVGLVRVRRSGGRPAFAAPPLLRSGPLEAERVGEIAAMLRIDRAEVVDAAYVDNGPGWVAVLLRDVATVRAVSGEGVRGLDLGVAALHPPGSPDALEVRAFFPLGDETREDPVTGSLNASLAQWLVGSGRLATPYVARQGSALGRDGIVHVDADDAGTLWIGGDAVTCVEGTVDL